MTFTKFKKYSFFFLLITLSSCMFFNNTSETKENEKIKQDFNNSSTSQSQGTISKIQNPVSANKPFNRQQENTTDIEIRWIAGENVPDGFIIGYGYNPDKVEYTIRVSANEVPFVDDPVYKKVFKYVLKNQPIDRAVYIRIVSFKDNVYTKPSKPFVVEKKLLY